MLAAAGFAALDWIIVVLYLLLVCAIGAAASRRAAGRDEMFLAGRSMPVGAVALSILATSLSAATFIGAPAEAYGGNLTYFSANIGGLLAALIVAGVFIPAFYRHGVTSIYELLGDRFGAPARTSASAMFMIGRVFASGARLFMVALPFALAAFGDLRPSSLIASILLISIVAAAYTALGGIRAVIWTDVLQAVLVTGTVGAALVILWRRIPADPAEILAALGRDAGGNKLRVLDFSLDPRRPYTFWTALVGFTLFNVAAFGTDQDLTQRMLTCRTARRGAASMLLSTVISWPVLAMFLGLGLLLHVFYARPDVMGDAAPLVAPAEHRRAFLDFILAEMPLGLRGLMMAGLFAAAMSSLDSALNAMASTTIADFVRPACARRGRAVNEALVSRLAMAGWALALAGFAIGCVWWQRGSGQSLITFALGVMVFAYAGLLGVFATALLTRRGSSWSAVAALAVGFVAVALLRSTEMAFAWQMTIASAVSFGVCCAGASSRPSNRTS